MALQAPGGRYTRANRFAQMLLDQDAGAGAIASPEQGLAHMLRQGFAGYLMGEDARNKTAAMGALSRGLMARPWVDPDTGAVSTSPAGGIEGAAAALGGLDPSNEYGAEMLQNVAVQKAQQDLEARLSGILRRQKLADKKADYEHEIEIEGIKAGADAEKFGAPHAVADPSSPTGYTLQQTNQRGGVRKLGAAKPPTSMYDPHAPTKKYTQDQYKEATEALEGADSLLGKIEQMQQLVANVDSGTFAQTKLEANKILGAMGIPVDWTEIGTAEAMKAKTMDFMLDMISRTKGAISEKEMDAFEKSVAGIRNTPLGNKMVLAFATRIAERSKAEAAAVRAAYANAMREGRVITPVEMDNARIAARAQFGPLVIDHAKLGVNGLAPPSSPSDEDLLRKYGG